MAEKTMRSVDGSGCAGDLGISAATLLSALGSSSQISERSLQLIAGRLSEAKRQFVQLDGERRKKLGGAERYRLRVAYDGPQDTWELILQTKFEAFRRSQKCLVELNS